MSTAGRLADQVAEFIEWVQTGRTVEAISQFYAPEVVIFENRVLARAGRDACIAFETEQLAKTGQPSIKVVASAVNERTGEVFLEYVIRFQSETGKHMLLEEVVSQRWERGLITQERFHYEGLVDESDPGD